MHGTVGRGCWLNVADVLLSAAAKTSFLIFTCSLVKLDVCLFPPIKSAYFCDAELLSLISSEVLISNPNQGINSCR
jgi:hypothetical protein